MIAHISGKIVEKFAGSVIVDVAGVGYEVIVPTNEFERAVPIAVNISLPTKASASDSRAKPLYSAPEYPST